MLAYISGLLTGGSLIIAIGAQNAFVIRQGLSKSHVGLVVTLCTVSDAILIVAGVGGLGALIQSHPTALEFIRWFGVAYLSWFGLTSFRNALKNQSMKLQLDGKMGIKKVILSTLALTWLNPHVYLDTVILMGSIANQFKAHRWEFALGGITASALWFFTIGFGASLASRYMSRAILWKILDFIIAAIMFGVALILAFYKFN